MIVVMRFSWIALPVLIATLAGAGAAGAGSPSGEDPSARQSDADYPVSTVEPPVVALPAPTGDVRWEWLDAQRRGRPNHPVGAGLAVPGDLPAREVRLLGHSIYRAELDFVPELTRAMIGFLSSCTTVCPPPSSR